LTLPTALKGEAILAILIKVDVFKLGEEFTLNKMLPEFNVNPLYLVSVQIVFKPGPLPEQLIINSNVKVEIAVKIAFFIMICFLTNFNIL
jgi:hypothetical protein